jgi:hypothetical protein
MNVIWLQEYSNATIMLYYQSGRGAARLARLHGVQEVGGSNPLAPTKKTSTMESFFCLLKNFVCQEKGFQSGELLETAKKQQTRGKAI